ncbi:hypothetical protein O3G_MSEX003711 [Manduca sexta]|uniref:U3 small nucleolar RNA-associated protein 14 homolog A n=1 Tax=Manduca sexta TaxID=7130 RepID=A0A922CG81_MANSE|nr:hypothetical protein O3G_MSEX003711 [Manduca sexta]
MEDFEDTEFVASEHDRLISAVSKLDKTQHITEPTRNEPTILNSEFNLVKRSSKLKIHNVVKILGDTAGHVKTSKKLLKTQTDSKVLPKPLEKPQVEKIKRATGYTQTKKKVGRWDPVVARNRTVDFVSLPLKQVPSKLQSTNEFLSKLKAKSDLELALDEIDPPIEMEKEEEEEPLYPMSYEEMVEHRQHLAKLRAQESYKAAKAKRQSKIKSKKYHRVLKKERLKKQLKEFEDLQKTNPEEALQKLEAIEKSRALERHTLRHKNTGKWAKNKMIRAKYDKEARQQIAEQLAVSRSLTQKTKDVESSDDDEDNNEVIPDLALTQDPMNPWMMQQKDKSNVDAEFNFGYKKYLQGKGLKQKEDSDSEDDKTFDDNQNDTVDELPNNQLLTLKERINKLVQEAEGENYDNLNGEEDNKNPVSSAEVTEKPHGNVNEKAKHKNMLDMDISTQQNKNSQTKKSRKNKNTLKMEVVKAKKPKKENLVATSTWTVESVTDKQKDNYKEEMLEAFESLENELAQKVEQKLKSLRKNIENVKKLTESMDKNKKKGQKKSQIDNIEYLKLRNKIPKVIIDEELIETTSKSIPEIVENNAKPIPEVTMAEEEPKSKDDNIDPSTFIEVKPKFLNTMLPGDQNEFDELDDDEQVVPRVNIEEVFEEDDVVASFRKEKEDEINKDKPEEINLTLPGWGAWGGKGVKAPKRKKNRFISKPIPEIPRRDDNKGDIIIKEYKDPKLGLHKVKELPYPFRSVRDYEASIRLPLGNTFIPEKAHKKLIKPSVITKAGMIIEPMDEDELLTKKHRNFKNEAVIKIINKD